MATVIINDTTPRVKYTANGSTTRFDFDFVCFQTADLVVYVGDTVAETGFTITHDPTTLKGYVTFDTAPAAGTGITLVRRMAYDQKVDFTQVALLKRDPLHNEFSRVFAMIQQINEAIGRSVTVDVFSDADPSELINEIEVLYDHKDEVITAAENIADISAVAANETNINAAVSNMAAIQDAPTQAANAASSAALAQDWANKMDGQVASTGYSSKYYAGQAANSAGYAAEVETNIQSIVDDAAQTLSERLNNPFFLGQSKYFEVAPQNASWLVSNGQYNASSVYLDLWIQLTGVELNSSLNVGDTIEIGGKTYVKRGLPVVLSTDTITDYDFVVNQNDQTFRLPLRNGERVLVKKYVNGSDWYNLYSDGWIEQGGYVASIPATTAGVAVTFFKPFRDTNYFSLPAWDSVNYAAFAVGGRTTTGMYVINRTGTTAGSFWIARGYAPIPTQSDFTEVAGLYYYVGDTVQDASLINAGAVLGQLSDKISRTAASDKELVVGWVTPDYASSVDYTSSWGTDVTTTKAGWVFVSTNDSANGSQAKFHIGSSTFNVVQNSNPSYGTNGACMFFVPANATWKASGGNGYNRQLYYMPCKGV